MDNSCKICGSDDCESVFVEKYGVYVSNCPMCGRYSIEESILVERNKDGASTLSL